MTYRELQQILKVFRSQNLISKTFKLNQKKAILLDEYNKVQRRRNIKNQGKVKYLVDRKFLSINGFYFPVLNNQILETLQKAKSFYLDELTRVSKVSKTEKLKTMRVDFVLDQLNTIKKFV